MAVVAERVIAHEIGWRTGRTLLLDVPIDPGLPPLPLLAGRAFPPALLERRLRFLRAMEWYPDEAPAVTPGVDPALPDEASLADWVAAVFGAAVVLSSDPRVGALAWSLGRPVRGVAAGTTDTGPLDTFFDRAADALDPDWRRRARADMGTSPPWSRLETATVGADRWFGRGRAGPLWSGLSGLVAGAGDEKRKRWG